MTDKIEPLSVHYMDHTGLFMVSDSSGDPLKGDLAFQERIAKLMAASPELLETVKDCLAILDAFGFKFTFEAKRCRAVIAQATGASQ